MLFPLDNIAEWELPHWARRMLSERKHVYSSGWYNSDDHHDVSQEYSRVVHVAFPNGVHYVVDVLDPDNAEEGTEGWVQLDGMFYVESIAVNTAQKKAYTTQQPHRVREVVWQG